MDDLKKTVMDISERFTLKMEEFQKQLNATSVAPPPTSANSPPSPLAREFALFRSSMLFCLENLQAQMELLFKMQDDQEMRSRRKILLIHGVNEVKDEDASSISNMLAVRLKCPDITGDSLSRCHRMGSRSDGKPRPLLIKLRDCAVKDKIWAAKTNLKGSGITLSEFLTKNRHKLFMYARKRFGIPKCWTKEGRIYVISADGSRHRIECLKDIDAITGDLTGTESTAETSAPPPISRVQLRPKKPSQKTK